MTRTQFFNLIFHKDSIAFIGSIIFFWFTISGYIDSYYEKSDLEANTGILISIDSSIVRRIDKPLFKETTKELYLKLNSSSKYFSIRTKNNFAFILNKLIIGDSLVVYTKPRLWGIFGIKVGDEICHLIKQKEALINFEDYKHSINGLFILCLISGIFFLIFFIVRFNKRYYREVGYLKLKAK